MRISNPPTSEALMATARSFGNYDLPSALADLIDNSIKAKSTHISINFYPLDDDVIVTIRDDGEGMSGEALIDAMRPASTNPEIDREEDDLGRFGWGMKSASLSQARVMTVITWNETGIFAAKWDIDDISNWEMDYFEGRDALNYLDMKPSTPSGTEVRWHKTDRLFSESREKNLASGLTQLVAQAKDSLALTFHRYLAGEGQKKISIKINDNELPNIDPFMRSHPATQSMEPEKIVMSNGITISLQPYILPHFSKLVPEEQRVLGGAEGMIKNQGFYVYRNKRLIIHGTWFKLLPHRDLSQLTRVMVDLPNSADHEWRITLDKSGAQLPNELKNRLRQIVDKFNKRSHSVHRKKGISIGRSDRCQVWNRNIKSGRVRYSINRQHPIIEALVDKSKEFGESLNIEPALKLLESYFPAETFLKDAGSGKVFQAIDEDKDFEELVMRSVIDFIQTRPAPHNLKDFLTYLRNIEPFASHWIFVEGYVKKNTIKILD